MGTTSTSQRWPFAAAIEKHFSTQVTVSGEDVVPTGLEPLDTALDGGLRRGQVTVIEALPGAGKSVLASDLTTRLAVRGGRGVVFMAPATPAVEFVHRVVASHAGVRLSALRSASVSADEERRLVAAAPFLGGSRIADSTDWCPESAAVIVQAARDYHHLSPDVLVFDCSECSDELLPLLPRLARELHVAVVATANADDRWNAPARCWGDAVIRFSRNPEDEPAASLAVVKNRYGPAGDDPIVVWLQPHYGRFLNASPRSADISATRSMVG